ncbi:MAG: tetratricopeptide repeat protein, partial [Halobacteria archaeon]
LDVKHDMVMHYHYWSKKGVEKLNRQKEMENLKELKNEASKASPQLKPHRLLLVADEYFDLHSYKSARRVYTDILKLPKETLKEVDLPYVQYRIALSYYKEKDYQTAIRKFQELINKFPESKFRAEAEYYLAKSLQDKGEIRQAIDKYKSLLARIPESEEDLTEQIKKDLTECFIALKDNPKKVEEYKKLFNRPALSGVIYLGEDRTTLGNWQGSYGNAAWILCAMYSPVDLTGGIIKPIRYDRQSGELIHTRCLSPSGSSQFLRYCVYTSDLGEPGRGYYAEKETTDPAALYNPLENCRRAAYWDDRGETHPHDRKGPDLLVDISIPEGVYRLALYMREHRVEITDSKKRVLVTTPRREKSESVYKCFVVFGPLDLTVHIFKDTSLCAILNGIFLDKLSPPLPLPALEIDKIAVEAPEQALYRQGKQIYDEMVKKWEVDPNWYYRNLGKFRNCIKILGEYLNKNRDNHNVLFAQWMIWQSYEQLPLESFAKKESFARFVRLLAKLNSEEQALSFLTNLSDSFLNFGEMWRAEMVIDEHIKLLTSLKDRNRLFKEMEEISSKYVDKDRNYAEEKFKQLVSLITTGGTKEKCTAMLKELAIKYAKIKTNYFCQIAYNKIRSLYSQQALTAEDQYQLAINSEEVTDPIGGRHPEKAIEEYTTLLVNYLNFTKRDEVYFRLIRQVLSMQDIKKAENIFWKMSRECPHSDFLIQAEYWIAAYCLDKGEFKKAKALFQDIVNRSTISSRYYTLAQGHLRKLRFVEVERSEE